jgi:hypothetical protein
MRTLGMILILLAVASLVVGVITFTMGASAGPRLIERFLRTRTVIEKNIDVAKEVIGDVEVVFKESQTTLDDYDAGRITNVEDARVKKTLGDIKDVMSRTVEVREQAKAGLQEIEDFKDEMEKEALGLAWVAAVCVATLVLSGWLLSLGILARLLARRRENPTS